VGNEGNYDYEYEGGEGGSKDGYGYGRTGTRGSVDSRSWFGSAHFDPQ
jgi:hypothetical protein